MGSEEEWYCDRAKLREVRKLHPDYSTRQLMQATSRSRSWVKKWKKRLDHFPSDDEQVLWSRPSVRKTPPPKISQVVVERILEYRDHPPDNLKRVPGPKTILYYLQKDEELKNQGLKPPNSTSLVWRILVQQGRIAHPKRSEHHSLERPQPYRSWQLDYKDASSVTVEADGKKQHLVEILNVVDVGTSAWLEGIVRGDFNAATTLCAMEQLLTEWGLPQQLTFDRDPRLVGGARGRDFPSAFVRFWHCLGVAVNICPPHRPDLNCFVERMHRSLGSECLAIHRPTEEGQVREVTEQYRSHYNRERPHQGFSCHNTPPLVAYPPPQALAPLPMLINPDQWLKVVDGKRFARKVDANGSVMVSKQNYYIGTAYSGKYVALYVEADKREFVVKQREQEIKRLPIKGLYQGQELTFEEYLALMVEEARIEQRRAG
jgi:hypothetical protein